MEMLFWAGMLFLSGMTEVIVLFLYLSHDDLKKGSVSALDITESLRSYFPIEILVQVIMSILLLIKADYLVFFLTCPMLIYNIKMVIWREFNCHAFFIEDYKNRDYIERISKYKTAFYGALTAYVGFRFVESFFTFMGPVN